MAIKYRVDRSMSPSDVPVGMNSIKYYGTSLKEAQKVYNATEPGKDDWNQPNPAYGVILSFYDGSRDFVTRHKGFSASKTTVEKQSC